jgi:plastocyanin
MRKGVVVLTLAGALAAPATAAADKEIVATSSTSFATPEVTMDQGEPLNFRNSDLTGTKHDVVAEDIVDGKPLFRSDLIGQGVSFVEGSQYLTTGTYKFFCSLHSSMTGTLTVSANGTPKPRPGGGGGGGTTPPPAGDTTAPSVSLNVGLLTVSKLKKARKLAAKVTSDEAGKARVTIKYKSRTIGRATANLEADSAKTIRVALGATARKLLKKGRKLTITATVTDASANTGTSSTTAPLR